MDNRRNYRDDYQSDLTNDNRSSRESSRGSRDWQGDVRPESYQTNPYFRNEDQYSSSSYMNDDIYGDRSYNRGRTNFGSDSDYRTRSDEYRGQDFNSRSDYEGSYSERHDGWQGIKEKVKGFFGKGPKGYTRSDERIKEDVSEALYRHYDVDASEIDVNVQDGEVTLAGTVPDRSMKRKAEEAIESCIGVKDVHNQLRIASSSSLEDSTSMTSSGLSQKSSGKKSKSSKSLNA